MQSACIFERRKDGRWECLRRRCRYVTKKSTYEVAPIHACCGGGPGTLLSVALGRIGITEPRWLIFKKRVLGLESKCGCFKRAQDLDRWFYSHWSASPIRNWVANYAHNLRWLRSKLPAPLRKRHPDQQQ
jgi:hypothetical protein